MQVVQLWEEAEASSHIYRVLSLDPSYQETVEEKSLGAPEAPSVRWL